MSERSCKATTKKNAPCRAAPLSDSDFCLAHADPETRSKTGFIPNNGKGGRPKNPRVVDVLREALEQDADLILGVYRDAMEATRAVVVGNGPSACTEIVPDYATRVKAADAYQDRVIGKPKQTQELTGAGGDPLPLGVLVPSDRDFQREVAEVLRDAEAVSPVPAMNGHSNGNGSNGNGHHA